MMSGAVGAASILGMSLVPRSRKVVAVLGALGLAIVGLLIRFVADPAKFWLFSPGIYFILKMFVGERTEGRCSTGGRINWLRVGLAEKQRRALSQLVGASSVLR
jgi:hypothetical protein